MAKNCDNKHYPADMWCRVKGAKIIGFMPVGYATNLGYATLLEFDNGEKLEVIGYVQNASSEIERIRDKNKDTLLKKGFYDE